MLTDAALEGKIDRLAGLKENVIIGKLIPAATGLRRYRTIEIEPAEPLPRGIDDVGLLEGDDLAAELGSRRRRGAAGLRPGLRHRRARGDRLRLRRLGRRVRRHRRARRPVLHGRRRQAVLSGNRRSGPARTGGRRAVGRRTSRWPASRRGGCGSSPGASWYAARSCGSEAGRTRSTDCAWPCSQTCTPACPTCAPAARRGGGRGQRAGARPRLPRRGLSRRRRAVHAPAGAAGGRARARGLRAPLGVVAVLGNHDWKRSGPRMAGALESYGISVLENDARGVGRGCGSPASATTARARRRSRRRSRRCPAGAPVIALSHDPDVFPRAPARVALTVSGHLHGGQVRIPAWARCGSPRATARATWPVPSRKVAGTCTSPRASGRAACRSASAARPRSPCSPCGPDRAPARQPRPRGDARAVVAGTDATGPNRETTPSSTTGSQRPKPRLGGTPPLPYALARGFGRGRRGVRGDSG